MFESNRCVMCGGEDETINHVFFSCKITWLVWSLCCQWIRKESVYHQDAIEHLLDLDYLGRRTKRSIKYGTACGSQWLERFRSRKIELFWRKVKLTTMKFSR